LSISIRLDGIYLFDLDQLIVMPHVCVMSVYPPKADISEHGLNVCFVLQADIVHSIDALFVACLFDEAHFLSAVGRTGVQSSIPILARRRH
jgi:hypothetical protein